MCIRDSSGSFVPMLTLGIPGSGTTAVMLGALLGFGIQPGPRLYMTNPEIFWSVIMSMYIGMVVLLILNLPLIPYIARILAVPKNYLIPLILFFSITGIYVMSFNNFDIYLMIGIAYVEAAQYGVPSLGGKDGGASDAINHDTTGLICDGNNLDDIYSSLDSMIENKRYLELGKNAKEYVSKFQWEKILEEYKKILN